MTSASAGTITTPSVGSGQNHVGSQISQDDVTLLNSEETSRSEGTQAGGTLQHSGTSSKTTSTGSGPRSKDYNDEMVRASSPHFETTHSNAPKRNVSKNCSRFQAHEMHHNILNNNTRRKTKSTENMNVGQ